MHPQPPRREFLKTALTAGSALALAASETPAADPALVRKPAPGEILRVGLVGCGERGTYLLRILLGIEGVEIRAVCDVDEAKTARIQRLVTDRHQPNPQAFATGANAYQGLCDRPDLDLVVNATPWNLHSAVALAALQAGKHVASEAPLAVTVQQCWQLIEATEKSGKHCALLENYCYQRDVLLVANLLRLGMFGELLHVEGGYQKDGRENDLRLNPEGNLPWSGEFRKNRQGNVYPTHDLGPLSQWLGIHRGDRFDYLVSMGSLARAFNEYGSQYYGPKNPLATAHFDMADVNVCLLRTVRGRTVYLISDLLSSRPLPRNLYRLMGSRGTYDRTLDKLYIEGKSPRRDRWQGEWEPLNKYYDEFDHPWWLDVRNRVSGTGHGASDILCVERMVNALRTKTRPDIDVYDAAAWSAVVELSEQSARNRSQAIDFPDFTRGHWQADKVGGKG